MALKTIEYTVTDSGITPKTEQSGGTQGGHNVTEVVMTLGAGVPTGDDVRYRVQTIDGAGGFYSTEFLIPSEGKITFSLSRDITLAGGVAYLYLVATKVVYEGEKFVSESQEFLSKAMRLRFENSGVGSPSEEAYRRGITGALLKANDLAINASQSANEAKAQKELAKAEAETAKTHATEAMTSANDAKTYSDDAKSSAGSAISAKNSAQTAAANAGKSAETATAKADVASQAVDTVAELKQQAVNAVGAAESAAERASLSDTSASQAAGAAMNSATFANERAYAADKSATAAAASETNAQTAAQEALKKLPIIFETTEDMLAWSEGVPGKNLLDISKFVALDYENEEGTTSASVANDGTLAISGGASSFGRVQYTLNLKAGIYTFSASTYTGSSVDGEFLIFINGAVVTGGEYDEYCFKYQHTFVISEQSEVVIKVGCLDQSYGNFYLQVEKGETATDYEPYTIIFPDCEVGTLLLIKETNVPDYWWNGTEPKAIEADNIGDIAAALDHIIELQNSLIGGEV